MAHSLNMDVIAEGVETDEQVAILTQQGCKRFQGYYFYRPQSALEIENNIFKKILENSPQVRNCASDS
ncbi:MAG: EAL domain-containing protein [Nitrosomonas sp.]|nr:EAL domain-containing protein [Nitrosomonas sp.]